MAGAGGDGTIREVAEGVLGTSSSLAVLPMGTGNDFARTLGFGSDLDLAIAALAGGKTMRVDAGRWRCGEQSGIFLNVAGCGFDAAVADRINRGFRHLRGTAAYLAAVTSILASYRATDLTIEVDSERIARRAMLCAFANAVSYGGGMRIAPCARISDGLLDLVLVREVGRFEFLRSLPRVFRGAHLGHPAVEHRVFRHATLTSDPPVPMLVDGEVVPAGAVTIDVLPSALSVVIGKEEI